MGVVFLREKLGIEVGGSQRIDHELPLGVTGGLPYLRPALNDLYVFVLRTQRNVPIPTITRRAQGYAADGATNGGNGFRMASAACRMRKRAAPTAAGEVGDPTSPATGALRWGQVPVFL